ncbi:MAG: BrnA antitoxin family protein [Prevotella sp.]|nr:BrnA antitoxin family protein [Alistipes senegalensis]MCM1358310.1 BrnA antitoxin family protein [Prevotella sp.]MCM1474164.1 BrnA antitoxin family protein [Muribaculaceae bacterium]
MIIRKEIDFNKPLTDEQKKMLEELKTRPVTPDDDCPELTAKQLKQFARVSEKNREERRKQTVTLRLSPQAVRTAKSLGKGYTSVLSRILENALTDAELSKRYL